MSLVRERRVISTRDSVLKVIAVQLNLEGRRITSVKGADLNRKAKSKQSQNGKGSPPSMDTPQPKH